MKTIMWFGIEKDTLRNPKLAQKTIRDLIIMVAGSCLEREEELK